MGFVKGVKALTATSKKTGGWGEAPPEGEGARSPFRVEGSALPGLGRAQAFHQRLRRVEGVVNSRARSMGVHQSGIALSS